MNLTYCSLVWTSRMLSFAKKKEKKRKANKYGLLTNRELPFLMAEKQKLYRKINK